MELQDPESLPRCLQRREHEGGGCELACQKFPVAISRVVHRDELKPALPLLVFWILRTGALLGSGVVVGRALLGSGVVVGVSWKAHLPRTFTNSELPYG